MRAYVINLDTAIDRWSSIEKTFAETSFEMVRISAVDGTTLRFPIKEYSEGLYRWFHGRPTSPGHIGCYLSHVKAMRTFLESDAPHALIAEDDLTLGDDFEEVLRAAMKYSTHWNVLRLTGLRTCRSATIAKLFGPYSLAIGLSRLKGTGAYVVDRRAAQALSTGLLPMRLPIDHALDREWFFGLRAASILPFPASQTEAGFRSSIHRGRALKLSSLRRFVATYPYQAVNEITRWVFRGSQYLRTKLRAT
jgi:glycosyl transferase family 25